MRSPLRVAVAATMMAAAVPALADVVIVSQVTSPRSGTRTQTQYVSAQRLRLTDEGRDTIVDLGSGRVTLVDAPRKEYSETSLDEVRAFLDQMHAAMEEGEPLFDRSLGATASVTVTRGTGTREIAGYVTQPYTLAMGDSMKMEVWMAPTLEAPARYFEARKVPYAVMGPMVGRRFDLLLDAMKGLGGLPLAIHTDYRMRTVRRQVITEAVEVRKEPIPAREFATPPNLARVEAPFGRGPSS